MLTVSNTAPKLSLDYKASASTNLYATVSRGCTGSYHARSGRSP